MGVNRKCAFLFIDDDIDGYISTIKLWTKIIVENHDVYGRKIEIKKEPYQE